MFTMKSILTITAATLMLVSVTKATPVNGIPNQPSFGELIKTKQDYVKSLFSTHGIQFTGTPNESNGIYYTKATQNKQPITLACGLNSNPKSHALKVYQIMIPGNTCYVLQGQCKKRYKDFAQVFSSRDGVKKVQNLWGNIGSGLNALEELGWYAHMNFEDICINEDKYGFNPYFINLSKAIPVGQGKVIVDEFEETTRIDEMNEFALNASLRLVTIELRNSLKGGRYWEELSYDLGKPDTRGWDLGSIDYFTITISTIALGPENK
ncbi:hypothetical protein BDF19DRAFT_438443 [Syncephalis fuscata]|nr:hypothetical protein BDF19DRAFT_438443 [Syncephalis fuscata]